MRTPPRQTRPGANHRTTRPRAGRAAAGRLWLAVLAASAPVAAGAAVDVAKLPAPAERTVDFDHDIKPIFEASCFRCHGPERPKSNFRLTNRAAALKGGEHGAAIVPGQSANSPLIHYVSRLVEDLKMPPPGKGEPLTPEQIGLLRAWIDQGVKYPAGAESGLKSSWYSVTSQVRGVSVSGNEGKFREHAWMPAGFSGGVEEFEWREQLGEGRRFTAEGRAFYDAGDYRLKLAFEQENLGFVRGGFEQSRKWSGDAGGYYPAFGVPPVTLGRDLYLDVGRAWLEAGLTVPRYPRLLLGYEYQFRDGAKSTLEWGLMFDPQTGTIKGVYPAFKDLEERTHVVKFDLSHTLGGFLLEDGFRGEFHQADARRYNVDLATLGQAVPDMRTRYSDHYEHFQGANFLRLEKALRPWLLVSAGYLYSRLEAEGSLSVESFFAANPDVPVLGDTADQIVLERQAHVFNANAQLGPWEGLTFNTGVQSDWSRQRGFGHAVIGGFATPYSANLDRFATDEHFGLRFTGLPATVIYAESRFQQESYGQFEQGVDSPGNFLRQTDAEADLRDAKAGFTVSPHRRVLVDANYRKRRHLTDYRHTQDTDASALPGDGYPGFILARAIDTDDLQARLVLHPASWLKATLKYQLVGTVFDTVTAPAVALGPGAVPGGRVRAGVYDAHVYSVGTTLTPWRRLYLSTTCSYSDSSLRTAVSNGTEVVPYDGDVYSVLASATFALSQAVDLRASYTFSRADLGQDTPTAALPLGIRYDRHGVLGGLAWRLNKHVTTGLEYGFFRYDEPTAAGANDYVAHALFASLTMLLP